MRIVGTIPHPKLKITLMHHGRFLLKLEDVDVEITYRFRDSEGIAKLEDAQRALDLGLLQDAERTLMEMSSARKRYAAMPSQEDEFPSLI
ncbi:MAG: hypothetical protein AB8F78_01290 [Saprospiraceae bacterium]